MSKNNVEWKQLKDHMECDGVEEESNSTSEYCAGCDEESREEKSIAENYDTCDDQTLALFKMVFLAAQKPDKLSRNLQIGLAITLTVILFIQVIWALILITVIINRNSTIAANALSFITLLVTAILAEVVAMAFVVVRFVFRTPLDTMIDLLKDIVNKRK